MNASNRCSRCGAPLVADDRFCSTCGASRRVEPMGKAPARRGTRLVAVMSLILVVVLGGVAAIYFTAPERRTEQPIARVAIPGHAVLAIAPGPPVVAFVGTGDHLLLSHDQGATWQTAPSIGAVTGIGVMPAAPYSGLVAGSGLGRVDAGNVTPVKTSLATNDVLAIAADPSATGRFYAIVRQTGLARSDDGGASWTPVGGTLPADATSLVVGGSGSARIFVGTSAHGVFDSADGQSWNNASGFVNGALPTKNVSAVVFDPRSGDQFVGPSGQSASGALFVGTDAGIFKSIDTGISWSATSFHHAVIALAVATDGSHFMLAIDPSGNVYRSRDEGISWGQ